MLQSYFQTGIFFRTQEKPVDYPLESNLLASQYDHICTMHRTTFEWLKIPAFPSWFYKFLIYSMSLNITPLKLDIATWVCPLNIDARYRNRLCVQQIKTKKMCVFYWIYLTNDKIFLCSFRAVFYSWCQIIKYATMIDDLAVTLLMAWKSLILVIFVPLSSILGNCFEYKFLFCFHNTYRGIREVMFVRGREVVRQATHCYSSPDIWHWQRPLNLL